MDNPEFYSKERQEASEPDFYGKWISVGDRYPCGVWNKNYQHLSEKVLVANTCCVDIACFDRNYEVWYCDDPNDKQWIDKITHWMPLPSNPHGV